VAVLRNIPIAPYSVVNLVAGASPLRFWDYLWGTALGFLPALVGLAFLGESLGAFLRDPKLETLLVVAGVVIGLALLSLVAGRRLLARDG
jgi:uncharacterized membrane protein YdjX (TVP38/TMEM64 family)